MMQRLYDLFIFMNDLVVIQWTKNMFFSVVDTLLLIIML